MPEFRIVDQEYDPAIHTDAIQEHPSNARVGDEGAIDESLAQNGFYGAILVQRSTGYILVGNHRYRMATERGAATLPGFWINCNDEEAARIMLADNGTNDRARYDADALVQSLVFLRESTEAGLRGTGFNDDQLYSMLAAQAAPAAAAELQDARAVGGDASRRQRYRNLSLDVIVAVSLAARPVLMIAMDAGALPGTNSKTATPRAIDRYFCTFTRHDLAFVDNEFKEYVHDDHIAALRRIKDCQNGRKVKYATVRDVMTRQQCLAADIDFYSLPEILDMAAEVSEYAENVIVIPKYPCLDQIPEQFMLGYSVASSYGATPLPIQTFEGRRVHLLGGGMRSQAGYINQMGDDIVSCDANMAFKLANRGLVYTNAGATQSIGEFGFDISNGMMASYVLSMGVFMSTMYHVTNHMVEQSTFQFGDDDFPDDLPDPDLTQGDTE